jgi:shikimate dehydrogenase
LLGAGGAAKGVLLPLLAQDPDSIIIANRTESKAEQLCQQFSDNRLSASSLSELEGKRFDLIINATSTSLSGVIPTISETLINNTVTCYDMVYGKEATPFLKWAKKHGAVNNIDGLGMLVGQAAVSFSIWRGVSPETLPVIDNLRSSFNNE